MPHDGLPEILGRIAQQNFFDGLKLNNLLTREEWANILGIHRDTLRRWERSIIEKVTPIQSNYFGNERRMRAPYLDDYQRFIIALIYVFKGGLDRKSKSHKKTIDFLKMNFTNLKREQFEQWRNDVHNRAVA
ncbi:MAG TPA: hypothetical protein V6D25_00600 [Leptolyngbyaceae cyanobacterium]